MTPGSVVFRNELIELIQYAPTTARVHRRPLVIVPPCINKYYILDLQPENSLRPLRRRAGPHGVHGLVAQHPAGARPAHLGRLHRAGRAHRDRVAREISGSKTVNALGFCVGGTLLACALAVLAARRDRSVASATFLTTMLDFADPGEIGVYVSRELLAAREPALLAGQRVHGSELAGAFASLRANDLVWNYVVSNYLKGETPPAFDLLYWNGDSANLPGPMYVVLPAQHVPRQQAARARRADDGRRARSTCRGSRCRPTSTRRATITSCRGARRTGRRGCSAATRRSCWARPATSPASINPPAKNRRNYWTNDLLTDDADDWLARARQPSRQLVAALGRVARAARRRAARRRRDAAGSERYPPLEPAPGPLCARVVAA